MSKVITFSRTFPAYHPRKGEPTYFMEKVWKSLEDQNKIVVSNCFSEYGITSQNYFKNKDNTMPKNHTIRVGNRWKAGDKFSPRIWSGKPYKSPQIRLCMDIEINKIWDIEMDKEGIFYLNGKYVDVTSTICDGKTVADNDGLDSDDFLNWFPVGKPFKGQVICWDDKIEY